MEPLPAAVDDAQRADQITARNGDRHKAALLYVIAKSPRRHDAYASAAPCAWQLIYARLKRIGELDRLDAIVPPKDWRPAWHNGPRKIVRSDHQI